MKKCTVLMAAGETCGLDAPFTVSVPPNKYGFDERKPVYRCEEHARRYMRTTNRAVCDPQLPERQIL